MIVHQALHGIVRGHALLKSSTELSMDEGWCMDKLSDMSGHLHQGEDFEFFHTGYPCGRFTVIARTWLDRGASRPGSVHTHSLLLSAEDAAELPDPASLYQLFRRPTSGDDLASYGEPLEVDPALQPEPALSVQHRGELWGSMFLVKSPTVVWEDPDSSEDAARSAWAALPAWLRPGWSWCTRALHPRFLGPHPLAFLAPGPLSHAAFATLSANRAGKGVSEAVFKRVLALKLHQAGISMLQGWWGTLEAPDPDPRLKLALHRSRAQAQQGDLLALLGCLDLDISLRLHGSTAANEDVTAARRALAGALVSEPRLHSRFLACLEQLDPHDLISG